MSNALIEVTKKLAARLDISGPAEDVFAVLKATAFKGNATEAQMSALMIVAAQYGLNPWTKEIYAFPDKQNGIIPVVGVDGWSRIINGHQQFDGVDFVQTADSCTCTIYRKDRGHPTSVTEYMSECRRPNVGPWQSHPQRMLRHKALIQCARLAFGYSGIYDQDEAERIIDVGGNVPDCAYVDTSAIDCADSIKALQEAFSAAWKAAPDKAIRESLTRAKDRKKKALQALQAAEVIDVDHETGEVIGHD